MTTQMQVDIIQKHLDEARARGAKILAGGQITVTPEGARFVQPTVLTDTTADMAIIQKVATAEHPIGVTYDRHGGRVWVASYSGVIQVFDEVAG